MIVFNKGINGDCTYSIYTDEERRPIFTNKGLEEFSKSIIRGYPDISNKIAKYFQESFAGNLPKEIDLSRLDPEAKANLIESISKKIGQKELVNKV